MKITKIIRLKLFIIISILLMLSANALEINEIMYNPEDGNEWIEIYNPQNNSINLSGWLLSDNLNTDELACCSFIQNCSFNLNSGSYAIITDQDTTLYNTLKSDVLKICVDDNSIGNGLGNNEDSIRIYKDADETSMMYNKTMGGNGNNKTLEKDAEGKWKESLILGGTPGTINSVNNASAENIFNIDENNDNLSSEELNIVVNSSIENHSVTDTILNYTNESNDPNGLNYTFQLSEANASCDWELSIEANESIFLSDEFKFKVVIKRNEGIKQNVTVNGEIKNLYGEIVNEYSPWKNYSVLTHNSKTYSPNLPEGAYLVYFWIESLQCEDINSKNNKISRLLAVKPQNRKLENVIEIKNLYLDSDNKTKWGDQFTVKIDVYKGDDAKKVIEIWVEKDGKAMSKKSKVNLETKFREYLFTLPIQLYPNCAHEDSPDGTAKLIVEGLGLKAEQEFVIEGIDEKVCKDYSKFIKNKEKELEEEQKLEEKKSELFQIIDLPTEVAPEEVLKVKLQVEDNKDHNFKAWSYLFRGNKCYSCSSGGRDDNLMQFEYSAGETKLIELLVPVDADLEEGEYNLMVKFNKDGQKTNTSLSNSLNVKRKTSACSFNESLAVLSRSNDKIENSSLSTRTESKIYTDELKGKIIYESSSEKAERLIPWILLASFALLSLILGWKIKST